MEPAWLDKPIVAKEYAAEKAVWDTEFVVRVDMGWPARGWLEKVDSSELCKGKLRNGETLVAGMSIEFLNLRGGPGCQWNRLSAIGRKPGTNFLRKCSARYSQEIFPVAVPSFCKNRLTLFVSRGCQ